MEKVADVVETMELPMAPNDVEEVLATDELEPFSDIIVVEDMPAPVELPKDFDWEKNKDFKKFLNYLLSKMKKVPQHSGKTTAGCERAIAYLKTLDKEISRAVSDDLDCDIDDQSVEKLRKDIRKMVKQLQKRHNEIVDAYEADDAKYAELDSDILKTADDSNQAPPWKCPECGAVITPGDDEHKMRHNIMAHGHEANDKVASACSCKSELTLSDANGKCPKCNVKLLESSDKLECIVCEAVYDKQLTKEAGTPRVQLIMNPLERALTGIMINAYVSQGKNLENVYAELKNKYKLTEREELSIQQLMVDLGYPIARNFMGMPHDNNVEFAVNYQA